MPRISRHPKSHHASPQPAHSAPHPHQPPQPNYIPQQPSTTLSASPAPPPRTNASLNLSVLQQHYPSTSQILTLAPFSVLYTFSPTTQSWEKCEVEGTLFVCALSPDNSASQTSHHHDGEWEGEREAEERYSVVILNRKGLDNFYLELSARDGGEGAVEVEITEEFTILQAMEKVWGLWIYGEAREGTARVIAACADRVGTHPSQRRQGGDIDGGSSHSHSPGEAEAETTKMRKQIQNLHLPTLTHATAHHQQPPLSSPSPPPPPPSTKPHPSPPQIPLDTKPDRPALPMFTPSADTQFFLSQGRGGLQQISRGRPPVAQESGEGEKEKEGNGKGEGKRKGEEENVLGALFAKAEREFLGIGKEKGRGKL